jgi:hypothetical protein
LTCTTTSSSVTFMAVRTHGSRPDGGEDDAAGANYRPGRAEKGMG